MKKITLCLMVAFLSLTFLPIQSNAATPSMSDSLLVSKVAGREDFLVRVNKTRKADLSKLNRSDKNHSQGMERGRDRDQDNGMNKGMYISVGCTFLLMILVIILV